MEFLKVFEEAKKLGMTKEEFLPIWELDCKKKEVERYSEAMQHSINKNNDQSEPHAYSEPVPKNTLQRPKMSSELPGDDLQGKMQYSLDQLAEKQEHQWRQLGLKLDQLQDEFRKHFEVLSNHISNVNEIQTSSLKLFLMQEINLLQQDLKEVIQSKFSGQEAVVVHKVASSQKLATSKDSQDSPLETKAVGKKSLQNDTKVLNLPKQGVDKKQNQMQFACMPEPASDVLEEQKFIESHSEKAKRQAQSNLPVKFNIVLAKAPNGLKNYPKGESKLQKNAFPANVRSSSASSDESSIEGTGFYAQVISEQMKMETASNSTKYIPLSTGKRLESPDDKKMSAKIKSKESSPSINHNSAVPNKVGDEDIKKDNMLAKFIINDSDVFVSQHAEFITPFYFIKSKACKIRFKVHFNTNNQLNVCFLVSNGDIGKITAWPISFTGSGFIYNATSSAYSLIWTLGPIKCNKLKPEEEITINAMVSLKTLRYTIPNVTFKNLQDKGFAGNNQLCFAWEINALEKS